MAHPDFTRLAAEQHPKALGEMGSWDLLLHNTDVATHTLDLAAVGGMVVQGEVDLGEPVLVVWTNVDDTAETDQRNEESSTSAAGSKRLSDDTSGTTQPDVDSSQQQQQLESAQYELMETDTC